MHYVYLLRSDAHPAQTYVGYSTDLRARLAAHNAGESRPTAKYRPWQLSTYLAFSTKQRALDFEADLKSHSGKAFAAMRLWSVRALAAGLCLRPIFLRPPRRRASFVRSTRLGPEPDPFLCASCISWCPSPWILIRADSRASRAKITPPSPRHHTAPRSRLRAGRYSERSLPSSRHLPLVPRHFGRRRRPPNTAHTYPACWWK